MEKIKILIRNIKYILKKNQKDNIPAISAQSAFFILLSFVPFLMFTLAVLARFGIERSAAENFSNTTFLDASLREWLVSVFDETYSKAAGIAVTTIIAALWSAGKGIYTVTEGIRVIYRLPNRYNWFIKRLFSMGYTFIMFVAMILALGGLVLAEFFDGIIRPYIKNLPYILGLIYTLRYLVVFVLTVLLIALALKMYLRRRVEDKRYASFRVQLPGAVIAAVGWIVLSLGIKIYVNYFNGFNIYGSLGTLAIVMIWMYFSIYILVFGIQINYIYCLKIYKWPGIKLLREHPES